MKCVLKLHYVGEDKLKRDVYRDGLGHYFKDIDTIKRSGKFYITDSFQGHPQCNIPPNVIISII